MRKLICMRRAELSKPHFRMDFTHLCSKCNEAVGVYPSGLIMIGLLGEEKVEIVCNVCAGGVWTADIIFPGTDLEVSTGQFN